MAFTVEDPAAGDRVDVTEPVEDLKAKPVEVRCTVCGDTVEGNGIGHSDAHGSVRIGRWAVTL